MAQDITESSTTEAVSGRANGVTATTRLEYCAAIDDHGASGPVTDRKGADPEDAI